MATNLTDSYGKILADNSGAQLGASTGVPADGSTGYNTGCLYEDSDGTSPNAAFVNLGTTSSAAFRPLAIAGSTNDGPSSVQQVRFTYDPSANTSTRAAGTYTLSATVPSGAIIVGGYANVVTAFSSAAGTAAVALQIQASNIIASATVGGAPWSTTGTKAVVPNGTTAGGGIATTAAVSPVAIVTNQALTGGKVVGWLNYIV